MTTWSRQKLETVARQRLAQRAKLKPVEQAALAYARWQGMTDEPGIDREAAKVELDQTLDRLDDIGPEGWAGLADLASDLGDKAIVGLMSYSLGRSAEQMKALAQEATPSPAPAPSEDRQGPTPPRRRRRDRDR